MKTLTFWGVALMLLLAPFSGLLYAWETGSRELEYELTTPGVILSGEGPEIDRLGQLNRAHELADRIIAVNRAYIETFTAQSDAIESQINQSEHQQALSNDLYERRIAEVLGEPVKTYRSPRVEIKIYELAELDYRGYMAKVKIFDASVFEVVLADDKVGGLEPTSMMARRHRGVLAVNGGGFGVGQNGSEQISHMVGATVVGGEVVQPFIQKAEPLFFAGIDSNGSVVGTVPKSQADVDQLEPKAGVSFIPVLLMGGEPSEVPDDWKNQRHPRTILGRYANDDLLLIVIDGRQSQWSKGATLERIQEKLLELGVQDAYNLDGGGSSTFYYNGQVLNKPSDGTERPVANAIVIKP